MVSSRVHARGFSLVEVLVSIVVLSMGLLGAAGMLMASVRSSNEAAAFTTALNLVRELAEKARTNRVIAGARDSTNVYLLDDWRAGSDAGPAGAGCALADPCSASELARWDIGEWKRRIAKSLPEARASVCFDETPWNAGAYTWACSDSGDHLVVKLGWEPRADVRKAQQVRSEPSPRLVMQLVSAERAR